MAQRDWRREQAQLTRSTLLAAMVAALGCHGTDEHRTALRGPQDMPERGTGCIDTPFIAGDHRATTAGIRCGRESSGVAVLLRGRVVSEEIGGLPGSGLEDLWVTLHPFEGGPVRLDALPPAVAESQTGPQGSFSLSLSGAAEHVVTVRVDVRSPPLMARRIGAPSNDLASELMLRVPLDDDLRAQLGLTNTQTVTPSAEAELAPEPAPR